MSYIVNIVFSVLLFFYTISELNGCRRAEEKFEPIDVYSLQTSKFQVKDILDTIVKQDDRFAFQELTNFMDTFIFERAFCLRRLDSPDSIKYFYYFSGDVKEWLTSTDSTLLVLSYISVKGKTYDAKAIKKADNDEIKNSLYLFNKNIINPIMWYVKTFPRYDIRMIDSTNVGGLSGKGVICRDRTRCDTLLLKYIDGGKYTGIRVVNH